MKRASQRKNEPSPRTDGVPADGRQRPAPRTPGPSRLRDGRQAPWWLGVAFLLVAGLLEAQQGEGQAPTETFEDEVSVVEVLLDVVVTDGDGKPVLGLGREDFRVEENGRPVEILSFSTVRAGEGERPLGTMALETFALDLEDTGEPRTFILLYHQAVRIGTLHGRLVHAGRQTGWWAEQNLRPGDRVAVLAHDRKLELFQDFTADPAAIEHAAVQAAGRQRPRRLPPEAGQPSLFAHLPGDRALRRVSSEIRDGLALLARAADAIPGRKHLLFFSGGGDFAERPTLLGPRPTGPSLFEALNTANVAVHAFNLAEPGDFAHRYVPSLVAIARETGGLYRAPRNFFTPLLRETSDTLGLVYVLSYRTQIPLGVAGYRDVAVTTHDPEHRILTRGGYFYGDP